MSSPQPGAFNLNPILYLMGGSANLLTGIVAAGRNLVRPAPVDWETLFHNWKVCNQELAT